MNQNQMVLDFIDKYGSITAYQAFTFLGVLRLSARIKDIKNTGIKIVSEWEYVKNRFGDEVRVKRYFRGKDGGIHQDSQEAT